MKNLFASAILTMGLLLGGCSTESDESVPPVVDAFSPQFNPLLELFPFPNDLYFSGGTDGTLNIPESSGIPGVQALNALDGFSTNASIKVHFNAAVDASSLVGGSTAHIFEVVADPVSKATTDFVAALVPGVDYRVGVSNASDGEAVIEFTPLHPLNPKSAYLIAITSGLSNSAGTTATANATYQDMKDALANGTDLSDPSLDLIKQLVGTHLAILTAAGVPSSEVLVSASFTTQSTTDVLEAAAATASAQLSQIAQVFAAPGVPFTTATFNSASPGYANVYAGTVDTPYYLSATDPVNTAWQGIGGSHLTQFNPIPVATDTLAIPALIAVPNENSPWYQAFEIQSGVSPEQAGYQWPLVIFQHGITGDRTNALFIADAFASAGFAVISIDQPLHGITNTASPFYMEGVERTFDLDLDENGVIDPSGSHTINLINLLVGRDNNRQASLDLHTLSRTVVEIDINGDDAPDFDGSQMHFVGQSLGAMVAVPFLAVNTDIISATLSVPGGGISDILRDSFAISPSINAGIAAAGIPLDTALYGDFFRNAQTVIDSADPLSFAADAAANHAIMLHKVNGDLVVPNTATDRLIAAMSLPAADQSGVNPGPLGAVTFTAGGHTSLLDPTASLAATTEMQTQAVVFAAGNPLSMLPGNGQVILIQEASVVELAAP